MHQANAKRPGLGAGSQAKGDQGSHNPDCRVLLVDRCWGTNDLLSSSIACPCTWSFFPYLCLHITTALTEK